MKFRYSSKSGRIGFVILVLLLPGSLILLLIFLLTRNRINPAAADAGTSVITAAPLKLNQTQQKILEVLKAGGVSQRLALYWLAVSAFETGNYTSELFKLANNAFGMRVPKTRDSARNGTYTLKSGGEPFSSFESVEDSARDQLLYIDALNYPLDLDNEAQLVALMKSKNYFDISYETYLAGVRACLRRMNV